MVVVLVEADRGKNVKVEVLVDVVNVERVEVVEVTNVEMVEVEIMVVTVDWYRVETVVTSVLKN